MTDNNHRNAEPTSPIGPPNGQPSQTERLWDLTDLANYLRVSKETIYSWRKKGYGPASVPRKMGGLLRYDPATVRRWVATDDIAEAA